MLIGARQTPRLVTLDEGRAVKTATDRAAEAIEAAEVMFADEMGATLDLSAAASSPRASSLALSTRRSTGPKSRLGIVASGSEG